MATASVSSLAALDTQLTAWATGGGDTVTEESVVTLADGAYTGGLTVSNLSFPYRVWVQGRAPSTNTTTPVRCSGVWNMSGTTNLGIRLMEFNGAQIINYTNSTNFWADRCKIYGVDVANPATTAYPNTYVLNATGTQNGCKFTNNVFGRCASLIMFVDNGSNQEITNNLFLDSSADFIRIRGIATGASKIDNNWFGKRMNPGTGAHSDCIQTYPSTASFAGSISGNVMWRGVMQRDPDIRLQCIFIADGGTFTGDIEQNIIVTDSTHGVSLFTSGGSAVDNNCCLLVYPGVGNSHGNDPRIYITAGDTGTRNFSFSNTASTGLDGTNLRIDPGTTPNFATILPYYDEAPARDGNIGQLIPIVSSGNHWNDSTPYGAATRLQEIINTGIHPGNVGWPVGEEWTDLWNNGAQDGTVIASNYSGSYNADGTNITTPAAPEITGNPTISGTLVVGATITFTPADVSGVPQPDRTWEVYNTVSGLVQDSAANSYVLQATDEGDGIYATQREENTEGFDTATSATTDPIGAAASAPTIVNSSPSDNATDVALDSQPYTLTFNKNIAFGPSGTVGLYRTDGTPTLRKTWNIAIDQGTGPNQVSISGATLTLTNGDLLLANKNYWFQISNGAIEGTDGSVFGGINDATTWSFTSGDALAPTPKNMARRMLTSITVV